MKPFAADARRWTLPALGLVVYGFLWWIETAIGIDQRIADALQALAVRPAGEGVLLIAYDEETVRRHGPWAGDEATAEALLAACQELGAQAVVYTAAPYPRQQRWDRFLERAAARAIPVVAPLLVVHDHARQAWRPADDANRDDDDPLHRGLALLRPDADGVLRALPRSGPVATLGNQPPLALATTEALGLAVPGRQRIGIHFTGAAHSRTPLAAWRLLEDDLPAHLVAGRICLIGPTDALAPAGLMTPTTTDGRPMPVLEVQANAIDALLHGRHPWQPAAWAELLLAIATVFLVARLAAGRRPLSALGLAAALAAFLVLGAGILAALALLALPLTRLLMAVAVTTAASLAVDLLRYQREMLGILAATNQGHWLFGGEDGLPRYDHHDLLVLLQLIDRALGSHGVLLGRRRGRSLELRAHHGCPPDLVRELERQALRAPPGHAPGGLSGGDLGLAASAPCWGMPVSDSENDRILGWLLCWPGEGFNTRIATDLVSPLLPQLRQLLAPQAAGTDDGTAATEEGVFSQAYLATLTARLQRIEQRGRDERQVIRHALGSIAIGLVLADGMGRCWYHTPHLDALLGRCGVEWSGKHIFTLLSQLTRRPLAQILDLLEPCYRLNEPVEIEVQMPGGDTQLRCSVTPAAVAGHRPGDGEPGFLPTWPNHLILLVDAAGRSGDTTGQRRELIDTITQRAEGRVRSLLAALDLDDDQQRSQAIRRSSQQLADLFQVYSGGTASHSMSYRLSRRAAAVDLGQLVDTVVAELAGLAADRDIALVTDFGLTRRSILADDQALHAALGIILERCLNAGDRGSLLQIQLRADAHDVELLCESDHNALRVLLEADGGTAEGAEPGHGSSGDYLPVRAQELERTLFEEGYEILQRQEGRILLEPAGDRGIRITLALPQLL